ncbi:hypothetical protein ACH4CD_12835 [Streptomyces fungicidicus]|uniref:hypothetical protein n=1 Tax=Streptomyces fungicidicus TaxID=68203 RepID=UPI0037AE8032
MSAPVLEGPLGPALLKLLGAGPSPDELATAAALLTRGPLPRPEPPDRTGAPHGNACGAPARAAGTAGRRRPVPRH